MYIRTYLLFFTFCYECLFVLVPLRILITRLVVVVAKR